MVADRRPDRHAAPSPAPDRERPTAVIALNDRVALGVYQAAQQLGLSIPDDLSVVSFDDSDLARWLNPGLSSLAIPHYEMGRRAVEILVDDPSGTRIELLPMPFRARESIGRLAGARRGRRRGARPVSASSVASTPEAHQRSRGRPRTRRTPSGGDR